MFRTHKIQTDDEKTVKLDGKGKTEMTEQEKQLAQQLYEALQSGKTQMTEQEKRLAQQIKQMKEKTK